MEKIPANPIELFVLLAVKGQGGSKPTSGPQTPSTQKTRTSGISISGICLTSNQLWSDLLQFSHQKANFRSKMSRKKMKEKKKGAWLCLRPGGFSTWAAPVSLAVQLVTTEASPILLCREEYKIRQNDKRICPIPSSQKEGGILLQMVPKF